jgi:hypothetical protein
MSSIKKFQRDRNRYVDEHGGGGASPRQWHSYVKAHRTDEDDLITAEGFALTAPADQAPIDPAKKWKIIVRQLISDYIKNPRGLYHIAQRNGPNSPEAFAYNQIMHPSSKIPLPANLRVAEASMNWAAHKSTGPKFSGYLKGTDPAPTEFDNKSVGGMEEGIDGNMTVRSNPLSQPLRKRNYVAKNAQSSGAGKHNNNLKAAAARGQVKHKGKPFELDEMTDDEVAKIRKDAEAYTTKQMTAPKKVEPKKSFMQQVGDKQIGMVKGAWKGLTGQLEESDNFMTWAVRNGYNFTKDPAIYESARKKYKALVESKGLGKRVRVVSGPATGQTGTIGEIRNGAFKGAPKYYTVDLDNGSHVQVRKEALRLINDVDEGWKSKLAGAALAGAAALGASGAHARVMPGDDPNINRLTGTSIAQTQAGNTDVKPSAPGAGFSKAYLQKVANGEHPRPMLSKEKAQELLSQMAPANVNESLKPGEYYIWTVYFDDGSQKRIKVNSDEFDPYAYYAKKNQVVVNVDYDWSIQPQQ